MSGPSSDRTSPTVDSVDRRRQPNETIAGDGQLALTAVAAGLLPGELLGPLDAVARADATTNPYYGGRPQKSREFRLIAALTRLERETRELRDRLAHEWGTTGGWRVTWEVVGEACGISRQAAHRRYARKLEP